MCEAKPGCRCAADSRTPHARTLAAYVAAHPGGPDVNPLDAAAGKHGTTATVLDSDLDEIGMPLYGAELRRQGRKIAAKMEAADTPEKLAATKAELAEHNAKVVAFRRELERANDEMAAFVRTPLGKSDPWVVRECNEQIRRNRRDLFALTA